jgi:membrane fusion protein (multidrug efflux system)
MASTALVGRPLLARIALDRDAIEDETAAPRTSDGGPNVPEAPPPKPRRKLARIVLPLLLLAASLGGGGAYAHGLGAESTDDAFVEAHVASVSPRIAGQVARVLVKDNQTVAAGDVLVELDDRDQKARLAAAVADVEAAEASLRVAETQLALMAKTVDSNIKVAKGGLLQAASIQSSTDATIEQARADIAAASSRVELARIEHDRATKLFASGATPKRDLDGATAALDQAQAAERAARARLDVARASITSAAGSSEAAQGRMVAAKSGPEQLDAAAAQVDLARARLDQAEAARDAAELQLSYTKVTAQIGGTVSRRNVEPGQLVSPERPLLALVPLDDTWVVANFKEDQLATIRPGQKVDIEVDAFGGRKLAGRVDSVAAGTGSRFALLPPDNASGNFTKVVQRVPVLIHVEPHPGLELRPGMSVEATVHTE